VTTLLTVAKETRVKFLKETGAASVGEYNKIIWFYQLG